MIEGKNLYDYKIALQLGCSAHVFLTSHINIMRRSVSPAEEKAI